MVEMPQVSTKMLPPGGSCRPSALRNRWVTEEECGQKSKIRRNVQTYPGTGGKIILYQVLSLYKPIDCCPNSYARQEPPSAVARRTRLRAQSPDPALPGPPPPGGRGVGQKHVILSATSTIDSHFLVKHHWTLRKSLFGVSTWPGLAFFAKTTIMKDSNRCETR